MKHPLETHGHASRVGRNPTPTYAAWASMIQRCHNDRNPNFVRYGARGIKVCSRWLVFENFLADMGERPDRRSLERKDNSGDYEPNNCRWATRFEQANNTRSNLRIAIDGVTRTLAEWCALTGVNKSTAAKRISRSGWPPDRAVTETELWRRA